MVNMVIGKKNIGKTTRLKELFNEQADAWGFSSEKVHDCGRVTAYELIDLRTGEKCINARLASLPVPEDFGAVMHHGPFLFADKSFDWARKILDKAIEAGAKAFFIDELGKLELQGKGHAELIRKAMESDMELFIAIRETNVSEATATFGFSEVNRIQARD